MPGPAFDTLKTLIVEDNMHMRLLLRSVLYAAGIREIYEASNGLPGLAIMRERKFDLILSDLEMRPMDGIEFCRAVRNSDKSANPFIPIILVTGHTEKRLVESARDAGITEILAKPITAHNLYARIAEIMERPRTFVRCPGYFGPDRRRRPIETYAGPWRRYDDFRDIGVC